MPTRDDAGLSTEALFLLRAARETGVLDALAESAGTPADVASATALDEGTAETVVGALADLGFLERLGDEYEPTNRMLGFLAKRDPRSVGRLPNALDRLDTLAALPETLTDGEVPGPTQRRTANRLGAAAATDAATVRARVTAALREVPAAETVLAVELPAPDAGGPLEPGVSADAREFAARDREVTYLADGASIDVAGPLLSSADVDPVTGAPSDLPGRFDLVYAVDRCGTAPADAAAEFVADAADRLASGGAVVLLERVRDRLPPEEAVAADVRALTSGAGSGARPGVHASGRYREWGDAVGLATRLVPVPGGDRTAVVYRRPERTVQED